MTLANLRMSTAPILIAFGLAACGGGSGDGSAAAPIGLASPTPTPTPTSTPTPAITGQLIAGAVPGQHLLAPLVCADGSFVVATRGEEPDVLADLNSIAQVGIRNGSAGNALDIFYRNTDSYDLGFGFDDVAWLMPSDKHQVLSSAYDYFNASGLLELELYRNALAQRFRFVTLGRTSFMAAGTNVNATACFFAAGLGGLSLPTSGIANYSGLADGIALFGGRATRLFGSSATATVDYSTRSATVRINLASREPPFGEFLNSSPMPIGQATAQIALTPNSDYFAEDTPFTGPDGSSGTITGKAFAGGAALGFVYELRFPNGDRAFGSIAVELPLP